ncbi:hypothetical protein [Nostoc sp. NMS7]|nr:hypothetical protein [Nostoc sp. NMS7]
MAVVTLVVLTGNCVADDGGVAASPVGDRLHRAGKLWSLMVMSY